MKKIVLLLLFSVSAVLPAWASDTVELLPGTLAGHVSLSSEVVKNGTVYANATDGSASAQSSFTGSDYSVVVPAGKSWRLTFYVYPEVPSGAYSYVYVALPDVIGPVPGDQTTTFNVAVTTARITADVTVANGTLASIPTLQAYGSTGGSVSTSVQYYGQNIAYAVSLPISNVSINGTAAVTSTDGQSSTQALASQTVAVSAAGATASWSLDAAFSAGAIQGDIALTGAVQPNSATLYLYAPSGSNVGSKSLSGNGSYDFTNLLPGTYQLYNYVYFDNAQLYLYGSVPAVAGTVTQHDYIDTVALARIGLNPTGFFTADKISSGYTYGYWTAPNPNSQGLSRTAYAYFSAAAGGFRAVLTPGEWKFSQINLNGYDYSQSGVYISYAMGIYDYSRSSQPVTFVGGDDQTLPSFDFDTTQTELTFDVVEPAGATSETLISAARISGYVTTYSGGSPQFQYSISSSTSTATPQPRQRVRIVGVPGTYAVQTFGTVNGSSTSFGNFTLELKAPLPTPAGTAVAVSAGSGVGLVFDEVTTGGVSTASQLPVGPALPGGYTGILNNGVKAYYSVSTTATFSGYVDVTIDYAADAVPAELAADLRLFYYDDASQTWIDVTLGVDEANHQIVGTAPALSLFAIGVPHAPVLDPVVVPADALAGEELVVAASFQDADPGEAHTATVTWGDGITSDGVVDESAGTLTAAHTYAQAGTYAATVTFTDITGKTVTQDFTVVVGGGDTTAPVLTFEARITAEATGPDGVAVDFAVTALDDTDGPVAAVTSVPSGTVFPLGTTVVTVTATDAAGNEATQDLEVTVTDTTAPTIEVPADLVLEATGAGGAAATFAARATDLVDGDVTVTSSLASGSTVALGTTAVTLTAVDAAGNTGSATFNVTVQDTTAPTIAVPANRVLEATGADGATAAFAATATDSVDGDVTVTSSLASGSMFPLGTRVVELTATDAAGNTSAGSFTVTVRDTTAPVINGITPSVGSLWPPNHHMVGITVTVDATDAAGAVTSRIVAVTSSEPDYTRDDDDRRNDIVVTGDLTVDLRAERLGSGSGRVYTLTVEVTDAAGNATQATTTIVVPHDQGGKPDKSGKSEKPGKSQQAKSAKADSKTDEKSDHKSAKSDAKSGDKADAKSDAKSTKAGASSSKSGPDKKKG